jgi:hypothetical protein
MRATCPALLILLDLMSLKEGFIALEVNSETEEAGGPNSVKRKVRTEYYVTNWRL